MTVERTTTKRPDLVALIAVYQFVVAAICLVVVLALTVALGIVVLQAPPRDTLIAGSILLAIWLLMVGLTVLNVATGWGLLAMQNWARWLAIVLGVFGLLNFPIGTLVGILKIWYLMTPEVREAFEAT